MNYEKLGKQLGQRIAACGISDVGDTPTSIYLHTTEYLSHNNITFESLDERGTFFYGIGRGLMSPIACDCDACRSILPEYCSSIRITLSIMEDIDMKYTKGTINIATKTGDMEVSAMIAENTGLAYHGYITYFSDTPLDTYFSVTHVPSGLLILNRNTKTDARKAITALLEMPVDWKQKDVLNELSPGKRRSLRNAIMELP